MQLLRLIPGMKNKQAKTSNIWSYVSVPLKTVTDGRILHLQWRTFQEWTFLVLATSQGHNEWQELGSTQSFPLESSATGWLYLSCIYWLCLMEKNDNYKHILNQKRTG